LNPILLPVIVCCTKTLLAQKTGGSIVTIATALARNPIRGRHGGCADDHQVKAVTFNPDSAAEGETSDEAQAFRCEVNGSVPLTNLRAAV
jgi:hypothetical protein